MDQLSNFRQISIILKLTETIHYVIPLQSFVISLVIFARPHQRDVSPNLGYQFLAKLLCENLRMKSQEPT